MHIQVILSSTRPNRVGERVAKWVTAEAKQRSQFEVELVDLADYNLPHFDEPESPRFNQHRTPNAIAKRWLAKVAEADGYVIVTPEYNHSIPASLKDALDYLDFQFVKKPVAIVSYGSVGGARAAEHLKGILIEVKAAVVPEAVPIVGARAQFDERGAYLGDPAVAGPPRALDAMLTELAWWTKALKAARNTTI